MNPADPFPADRVFPSHEEMFGLSEEMIEFCNGYQEMVIKLARTEQELETAQRQNRAMGVS